MTDPLPGVAQALLKAAMGSRGGRFRVIATLRAAADCLTDATSAHTLYAIADELENQ